jgi:hypothetical protein
MKNKIVLIVLLALPIAIYMIFATATHNSLFLPTISKANQELPNWKSYDNKPVVLKNKITILGFLGKTVIKNQGNLFNLNQKIYGKYVGFQDFQLVMIVEDGKQAEVKDLLEKLGGFTENLSAWKFVFAKPEEIQAYYNTYKLNGKLNNNLSTAEVIIIDKDLNHRGRKGKDQDGISEYKESYNTTSAADLHNEMSDDVKIMLREYRLALKRNKNQQNFGLQVKK